MLNKFKIYLSLILLMSSSTALCEWDPNDILPNITIIGRSGDPNTLYLKNLRDKMLDTLNYWQERGLQKPEKLEGIYAVSSYEEVGLIEFLQILNPSIKDIKGHIEKQYSDLDETQLMEVMKHIVTVLNKKNKKGVHKKTMIEKRKATQRVIQKLKSGDNVDIQTIKGAIFDFYAMFRYGHTVKNFYQAVQENLTMKEIVENHQSEFPNFDNAFYGKFWKLDILDILYKRSGTFDFNSHQKFIPQTIKKLRNLQPEHIFKMHVLESPPSHLLSRRLVLLPLRTQQAVGDYEVNAFKDLTVGDHELAHHLNTTVTENRDFHRQIDEVMADYLQAVPEENPIVGRDFAEASDVILDRLSYSRKEIPFHVYHHHEHLASKRHLRKFSQEVTLNDLSRKYLMADDYEGGNPLRFMLWRIRHFGGLSDEQVKAFDEITLKANKSFSQLPLVIPQSTQIMLSIRSAFIQLKLYLRALEIEEDDKMMAKIENAQSEIKRRPVEFKKAQIMAMQEFKKKELQSQDITKEYSIYFQFINKLRFFKRKSIAADYVNAEYIRVLYREAQKASQPEIAMAIKDMAEVVTNSKAIKINFLKSENELIFSRKLLSRINPITRLQLRRSMKNLKKLSVRINKLKSENYLTVKQKEDLEKLTEKYSKSLAKIGEYERTGRSFSAFIPHAFPKAMLLLAKTTYTALKLAIFPFKVILSSNYRKEFFRDSFDRAAYVKETKKFLRPLRVKFNKEDINLRLKFNDDMKKASRSHVLNIPNILASDSQKIASFVKEKTLETDPGEVSAFTLHGKASSTHIYLLTKMDKNGEFDIYVEKARNYLWKDIEDKLLELAPSRGIMVPRLNKHLAKLTDVKKVSHRKRTKIERVLKVCQILFVGD